jgi:NAD(P)-dependent dehydrogenase (short-subunit alcohol dehydrogenase family)
VTDNGAVERLAAAVPRLDLFINAVLHSSYGRFMDTPLAAFENSLRVGFLGPARLTGELLRREKIGGKIVMVLSSPPVGGRAGCSGCAAGRAALWAFARVLRRSVGNNMQVTEVMVDTCPRAHCAPNDGQDAAAAQDPFDALLAHRIMQAERSGKEIVAVGRRRSAMRRCDRSPVPCTGELPR